MNSRDTDDDDDGRSLPTAIQARDWVLRMQTEYRFRLELSLRPLVVEWNLVLQA